VRTVLAGFPTRPPHRAQLTVSTLRSGDRQTSGPARGSRHIIDGRIVVIVEHTRTNAGGIAFEMDSRQAGADSERIIPTLVTLVPIVTLVRQGSRRYAKVPILVTAVARS